MEKLAPGKISSRLQVKRGCEANILATIPSTQGKWGNVQKGGWTFSPISIPWGIKLFNKGSPILHTT